MSYTEPRNKLVTITLLTVILGTGLYFKLKSDSTVLSEEILELEKPNTDSPPQKNIEEPPVTNGAHSRQKEVAEWLSRMETEENLLELINEIESTDLSKSDKNKIIGSVIGRCTYIDQATASKDFITKDEKGRVKRDIEGLRNLLIEDSSKTKQIRKFANPSVLLTLVNRCRDILNSNISLKDYPQEQIRIVKLSNAQRMGYDETYTEIIADIIKSPTADEIAALNMFFAQELDTTDKVDGNIESLAWQLAACEFGNHCNRGSLTMLVFCGISLNHCDEHTDMRAFLGEYHPEEQMLLAEARASNLRLLIETKNVDAILQHTYREGTYFKKP